jgi:hypothetical protein
MLSQYNLVNILIDHGADTEHLVTDSEGKVQLFPSEYDNVTPLFTAIEASNYKIVKLLFLRGAKLYPFECNFHLDQQHDFSLPKLMVSDVKSTVSALTISRHVDGVHISKMITEDALKVVEVYREFGGSLWPNVSDTITDPYTTARNMVDHEPEDTRKYYGDFPDKLDMLMTNPRTLQSFCRVAILNQMGRKFWTDVSKLPLPRDIIEYLLTFPT